MKGARDEKSHLSVCIDDSIVTENPGVEKDAKHTYTRPLVPKINSFHWEQNNVCHKELP